MGDNIIDSRERFRARGHANSLGGDDQLESDILAKARLLGADKAKFAENLGKLAAKVNPANPLLGAQKIIQISGLEGIWEKRKRYFRFPGEDAPAPSKDGEYGSRPRTFVSLAHAAGACLGNSDREDVRLAERRRIIRALAEGTSFAPTFVPSDPADRTAKSLLDHFSSALCAAVAERTRITDLWTTLKDSPFGVDALDADELSTIAPSPYGDAAIFPPSLLRPFYRNHIIAGRFNTIGGTLGLDTGWATPTLAIGLIGFPVQSRVFVLPDEVAAGLCRDSETDEGLISESAQNWLADVGYENGSLPEISFTEERGYGWKSCHLSVLRWVGLEIVADDNGAPHLQVATWGDHDRIGFNFCEIGLPASEKAIAESVGKYSQARYVDVDGNNLLFAIHAHPFDAAETDHPLIIGLLASEFDSGLYPDDFDCKGWTEDQEAFAVLASNKGRFYPTVAEAEPVNGPVMGGSVGASILQNVRFSSKENSIAALLIQKAQLTADAGLKFRDRLIETYREAFRDI